MHATLKRKQDFTFESFLLQAFLYQKKKEEEYG